MDELRRPAVARFYRPVANRRDPEREARRQVCVGSAAYAEESGVGAGIDADEISRSVIGSDIDVCLVGVESLIVGNDGRLVAGRNQSPFPLRGEERMIGMFYSG